MTFISNCSTKMNFDCSYATHKVLMTRDYQQMLTETGFEATPDSTPEEFRQALAADVARWRPIVTALALKID
jgi:tripartite-type tricarboxylate transporter receptor subunit TctC